jgi:hypothetical protein
MGRELQIELGSELGSELETDMKMGRDMEMEMGSKMETKLEPKREMEMVRREMDRDGWRITVCSANKACVCQSYEVRVRKLKDFLHCCELRPHGPHRKANAHVSEPKDEELQKE